MTDTQAAHAVLEELPLGKAHLMTFQLTPIGPKKSPQPAAGTVCSALTVQLKKLA
jgi:hypothetical protein